MPSATQIPLDLRLNPQATFEDFVTGPNAEAVDWLRRLAGGAGAPVTYLWGPATSGRSHLLQATCRAAHQAGFRPAYLPLGGPDLDPVVMLDGVAQADVACLDDIGALAGHDAAERAAFALCNRLRDAGARLVVAAGVPPSGLPVALPDLRSRLGWGPVFQLRGLDDETKLRVLVRRARQLGFELTDEAARYLLSRHARGLGELLALLHGIDRAALAAQRRVTVPFLRDYLRRAC
ncbi:MAG: DnaA regulatory inactivator Hda [Gammaproteobacteria bacterium]|nr:DnaA regulatory inactivator Hda [Gammaproteobacteria bacterium]